MNKLEDVDDDALREALREAPTTKAVKRLMIALAYADGVRVETVSDRYGISRATVYSCLDRFEHQSISEAIKDESRPGRPPKLDASQREGYPISWRDHRPSWDTRHQNGRLNVHSVTLNEHTMSPTR